MYVLFLLIAQQQFLVFNIAFRIYLAFEASIPWDITTTYSASQDVFYVDSELPPRPLVLISTSAGILQISSVIFKKYSDELKVVNDGPVKPKPVVSTISSPLVCTNVLSDGTIGGEFSSHMSQSGVTNSSGSTTEKASSVAPSTSLFGAKPSFGSTTDKASSVAPSTSLFGAKPSFGNTVESAFEASAAPAPPVSATAPKSAFGASAAPAPPVSASAPKSSFGSSTGYVTGESVKAELKSGEDASSDVTSLRRTLPTLDCGNGSGSTTQQKNQLPDFDKLRRSEPEVAGIVDRMAKRISGLRERRSAFDSNLRKVGEDFQTSICDIVDSCSLQRSLVNETLKSTRESLVLSARHHSLLRDVSRQIAETKKNSESRSQNSGSLMGERNLLDKNLDPLTERKRKEIKSLLVEIQSGIISAKKKSVQKHYSVQNNYDLSGLVDVSTTRTQELKEYLSRLLQDVSSMERGLKEVQNCSSSRTPNRRDGEFEIRSPTYPIVTVKPGNSPFSAPDHSYHHDSTNRNVVLERHRTLSTFWRKVAESAQSNGTIHEQNAATKKGGNVTDGDNRTRKTRDWKTAQSLLSSALETTTAPVNEEQKSALLTLRNISVSQPRAESKAKIVDSAKRNADTSNSSFTGGILGQSSLGQAISAPVGSTNVTGPETLPKNLENTQKSTPSTNKLSGTVKSSSNMDSFSNIDASRSDDSNPPKLSFSGSETSNNDKRESVSTMMNRMHDSIPSDLKSSFKGDESSSKASSTPATSQATPFGAPASASAQSSGATASASTDSKPTPFGTSAKPTGSSSLFGASSTPATSQATPFGAPVSQSSASFGASSGAFGSGSNLGPQTSSFGSSASASPFGAPAQTPSSGASKSVADQVYDLYKAHNPQKLEEIPKILAKYRGNEEELLKRLKAKYENAGSSPAGTSSLFQSPVNKPAGTTLFGGSGSPGGMSTPFGSQKATSSPTPFGGGMSATQFGSGGAQSGQPGSNSFNPPAGSNFGTSTFGSAAVVGQSGFGGSSSASNMGAAGGGMFSSPTPQNNSFQSGGHTGFSAQASGGVGFGNVASAPGGGFGGGQQNTSAGGQSLFKSPGFAPRR